ncbi:MerR family transcriptional regulator [Anaerovorax odorimutans]|nr:MerR family transcriptional regulator [Anaerovorax odorimutans]
MEEKIYFTSGEFAKLCGTTKETLRHYHNKGILMPQKKGENGYFYYEAWQFFEFDLIGLLIYAGNSLEQIREYLQAHSTERFLKLMDSSKERLLRKKAKIENMLRVVENTVSLASLGLTHDGTQLTIVPCKTEYYLTVPIKESDYENKRNLLDAFSQFWAHSAENPLIGEYPYSYVVPEESYSAGDYAIKYIAGKLDEPSEKQDIHTKWAGRYGMLFHYGSIDTAAESCRRLCEELRALNLEPSGPLYVDELISNHVTPEEKDHVTKVSIRVGR